jgi:hypothetical protein
VQFASVLEFNSSMQPKTLPYASSNPFSSNSASFVVRSLRCSFKKVKPSVPDCTSGFSTSLQIVSGRGITSAEELEFDTKSPAAIAAATTLADTATVVACDCASMPNGPTGTAAPLALIPVAQDETALFDACRAIRWT